MSKQLFIKLVRDDIKRDGIENLLNALEKTDFYTAPASTRYHDNYEGGLVDHSIYVYNRLMNEESELFRLGYTKETIAIVSLFHDLCKMGYYTVDYRNAKNDKGVWEKVPYYTVKDLYPFGHGEKSVDMLRDFIQLTTDEKLAIRWHMGGFEPKENYNYLSVAYHDCPLGLYLHLADMKANYLDGVTK